MRRRSILALAAATGALVVALTGIAQAAPAARKSLSAFSGPQFVIGMGKKKVAHGQFRITIRDRSGIHNFHLTGPGLNKKTGVSFVGTATWNVTLKPGTYKFVCDPHRTSMKGTIKVT
jgi:plastocyanin